MEGEQRLQRLRRVPDLGPWVAVALEPTRDAGEREPVGLDVVELLPADGRRDLAARAGPRRPRAEHGLVRGVLVVIDEDAPAALLLPPGRSEEVGAPALELARRRDRGGADRVGVPAGLQPDVDVQPAVARRLREAGDPELVEQGVELARGFA